MKTHLSLATQNLNESVAFYSTLLNSKPAKHYDDYALFLTESPGLELALTLNPRARISSDAHYGLAVDTPDLVDSAIERLKGAGIAVDIETEEICCYAKQSKVWATDPDGRRWETYYVIAETDEGESEDMSCCRDTGNETTCCSA